MKPMRGVRVHKLFFSALMVVVLLLSGFSLPSMQAQVLTIYYAAPEVVGAGDCSAWADACSLQTALSIAVAPAEIWVKEGVYKPITEPGNVTDSFSLHNGVAIYGGFAGVETAREQRDWQENLTILSGDIEGDDLNEDGNFIIEDVDEIVGLNSRHVVVGNAVDETSVLDGFVITAGSGIGYDGAGILLINGSKPLLVNLTIIGNEADTGGGMQINNSGPTVINCGFYYNFASYRGGAIRDCGNITTNLINCAFVGNVSIESHGAAIETNYSIGSGGVLRIVNSLFSQNYTAYSVAGIFADNARLELYNVTFSENISELGDPAVVYSYQSIWTIGNVIVWGNHSPENIEFRRDTWYYSPMNVINSDIHGCGVSGATWNTDFCGDDGGGNVQVDPLFVSPQWGDFRLGQSSPVIDAGNNNFVPAGITTDLDGNARFVDMPLVPDTGLGTPPIVDMGAYETYEDAEFPTVSSITGLDPNPTNANQVRFLASFSEPVFGVTTDSFLLAASGLTGASVDHVMGGPSDWVVGVSTGSGDGSLRLDVPASTEIWDLMGNPLGDLPYEDGDTYQIDRTPPQVLSSLRAGPDPTGNSIVDFTVTFTEGVNDVDISDFELTLGGNITGASIDNVTGWISSFTVQVLTGSGDGTIRLDVAEEAVIHDAAGNLITDLPYTAGEAYTMDKTAPTVLSILRLDPNPTPERQVDYAVTFSEPVFFVDLDDFKVAGFAGNTGAWATGLTRNGDLYVVTVYTGTGGGRLRLDLGELAWIVDAADNYFSGPYTSGEEYTLLQLPLFLPQLSK